MSVFGGDLPKELKELGLTPEQIVQALKDKKSLEEKFAQQDRELGTTKTALQAAENGLNEVKTKLTELEANPPRGGNPNPPDPNAPAKLTSFFDDEDKAFMDRAKLVMGPAFQSAMEAASGTARLQARMSLQGKSINTASGRVSLLGLWDKWQDEIDAAAKTAQPQQRGQMKVWLDIFDYVKGTHMQEMMEKPDGFLEPVESGANVRIGNQPPPEKLDEEQTATLEKMNRYGKSAMTPEKILELRKKMKFVV